MKKSRITLIGLTLIIGLGFLIFGLNYLKGNNFFSNDKIYYAKYNNALGLKVSNPVLVNGFKVGQVKNIDLILSPEQYILVQLSVDGSILLNDQTQAMIYSLDLMGSKGIDLKINKGETILNENDTLLSLAEKDLKDQVSAQILPLKLKVEDLVGSVEDALKLVKELFNTKNVANLGASIHYLKQTLHTLSHTSTEVDSLLTNSRPRLETIFSNLEIITSSLSAHEGQFQTIMSNLENITDSLAQSEIKATIYQTAQVLTQANEIITKINEGKGSIGLLINNETLYNNLEASSRNLSRLLLDVRENPKRYVHFSLMDFGKTVIVDSEKGAREKRKKKTLYQLQIKSSKERISLNSNQFKGYSKVTEHYIDGLYKYTAGKSKSYNKMKRLRNKLNDKFPDAFITTYPKDSIIITD